MSSTPEETVTANRGSPADADASFGHLVNVLNSGLLALMISLLELRAQGHKLVAVFRDALGHLRGASHAHVLVLLVEHQHGGGVVRKRRPASVSHLDAALQVALLRGDEQRQHLRRLLSSSTYIWHMIATNSG